MPIESTPQATRWCALFLAVIMAVASCLAALTAIEAEVTGVAVHRSGPRGIFKEKVTKLASPAKFQAATARSWFSFLVTGALAAICFAFYRALTS